MKACNLYTLCLAALFTIALTTADCSNKSNILNEVSGKWIDKQNNSTVEIQLTGESKTLKVNGQTYAVTVDKVEEINFLVNLKVKNGGAEPELWTLKQIWDMNGSGFKLGFNHNGANEVLIPNQQS